MATLHGRAHVPQRPSRRARRLAEPPRRSHGDGGRLSSYPLHRCHHLGVDVATAVAPIPTFRQRAVAAAKLPPPLVLARPGDGRGAREWNSPLVGHLLGLVHSKMVPTTRQARTAQSMARSAPLCVDVRVQAHASVRAPTAPSMHAYPLRAPSRPTLQTPTHSAPDESSLRRSADPLPRCSRAATLTPFAVPMPPLV